MINRISQGKRQNCESAIILSTIHHEHANGYIKFITRGIIMPDVHFTITPVAEKPIKKQFRSKRSSKYAPIIDAFLESEHKLVKVENTGKEANYLCIQLKKVCEQRGLGSVTVSVRNKEAYLEKISE